MKKEKILERLDQYRAIEINNLWQRSVFLGAFLILGYTGYGFLLDKMLSPTEIIFDFNNMTLAGKYTISLELYHFIACALACINIIFSVLWIAMAKGSKAWYEVYENAIHFVENSDRESFSWKEIRCEIDLRKRKMYQNKKCECRNNLDKFENKKNNCLFSTKAGGYSPAKINIALGQISFFLWLIVITIHLIILCENTYEMISKEIFIILASLIVWATSVIICNLNINKITGWIESSYFSDKKIK